MIALATNFSVPPLAISGSLYEIDFETGIGMSRKIVKVARLDESEDMTEVHGHMEDSGLPVVFQDTVWAELNPQLATVAA